MSTYSHSRLSTFEQCRLKFKYRYIDKIETDIKQSIEVFMGSLVHEALEKLYKDLKFEKVNSKEEILTFYNKSWQAQWTDDILIVRDGLGQDNYRKMGEKYLSEYYEHYKPFDDMKILGLETTDFLELSDGSKYHVRIDRLGFKDNKYFIVDYKTNSSMKDKEEADNDRQLAMYCIWVKKKYPDAEKIILQWNMLAFDKEVTSERTDEQLKNLMNETVVRIKEIESCRDFPAKVSALCNWCEFKPICPEWKHEFDTAEIPDDGTSLVNEYAELKANEAILTKKIEVLRDKILSFAESQGVDAVFGDKNRAKIWSKEVDKFPKSTDLAYNDFVAEVKELGIWNSFSRLDQFKLEKAFENKEFHGEVMEELRKFAKKEKISRIYLGKK